MRDDYRVLGVGGRAISVLLLHLVFGNVSNHSRDKLSLEVLAQEVVQDGIDHTMDKAETVYDVVEEVQELKHIAVEEHTCSLKGEDQQN